MLPSLMLVYFILVLALDENVASDFGDLGKLLLGGVLVAIVVAVAFTLIRIRLRDKKPPANDFISINLVGEKE